MANAIEFDYEKMSTAESSIRNIAGEYKTAATTFQSAFEEAIASWEGDSKNKLLELVQTNVMQYLNSLETAVNGLATLLKENATEMQTVDSELSESISNMISQ
jgi:uncharacterized protein YukE